MPDRKIGVVIDGATGRLGTTQHLRALLAIRAEGGLPLLQFALTELWEAKSEAQKLIPASALSAMGGVEGALARHADGVLLRLLPAQRAAARRILGKLITVEGTRARRSQSEIFSTSSGVMLPLLT